MINRSHGVPLNILLEILDGLHNEGLGAGVERALLMREDIDLVDSMLSRLRSPKPFVRKVAVRVLGRKGDRRATVKLLAALEDPASTVRWAAGSLPRI